MMDYAYAKMDTFYLFIEGLVKVIVNIIRKIVSFDNLKYNKKQSQGKRTLTKAKV